MSYATIRLEHEDGVSTITLDRPPVTAVSAPMTRHLIRLWNRSDGRQTFHG